MKDLKILNTLALCILQKVTLENDSIVRFYFGDTPDWSRKGHIKDVVDPSESYEVIEVKFSMTHNQITDLYWKIHRYIGEEMFLQLSEPNKVSIWEGVSEFEEDWGFFDDLEDGYTIVSYKVYNSEKQLEDWRREYVQLRKQFYSLHHKKKFQMNELREKIKEEIKGKIESRLEYKTAQKTLLTEDDVKQVISLALNDLYNGIAFNLYDEFIFEY